MNNKSLAPLIISFAAIILLSFLVVNSMTTSPQLLEPGYEADSTRVEGLSANLRLSRRLQASYRRVKQSASDQSAPDAAGLVEEAKASLFSDDVSGAEDKLRTALVFQPENPEALSLLGKILFQKGRYAESEYILSRLAKAEKYSNPSTLNDLASVMAKSGKFKNALDLCLKAQELDRGFADAYINAAAIYAALGDDLNACKHLFLAYKIIGSGILPYTLDPVFDKLRDSALEFKELVERARKDAQLDPPPRGVLR